MFLGIVVLGGIYFAIFTPQRRKLRKIKEIAQEDFQNARGHHHLEQLYRASESLHRKSKAQQIVVNKNKKLLSKTSRNKNEKLARIVETRLVEQHFEEIPGIGQQISKKIVAQIFNGRLRSLRNAYHVSGVGEERQRQVNNWIAKYEKQVPLLCEQEFPGKTAVINEYKSQYRSAESTYVSSQNELDHINARLEKCLLEINKLNKVTVQDFVDAKNGLGDKDRDSIDYFIQGVFGEWEKIPDWYKKLMEEINA